MYAAISLKDQNGIVPYEIISVHIDPELLLSLVPPLWEVPHERYEQSVCNGSRHVEIA